MEPQIRRLSLLSAGANPKRRKIRAELDAEQRQARRQAIIDAANTPSVRPTPTKSSPPSKTISVAED